MKKACILSLILFTVVSCSDHALAQDGIVDKKPIEKFSGEWYNKKQKRQLVISYDPEINCFMINDHTRGYSTAVYNACTKGNKLVMPAQNKDHHSSYCEISIVNNQLIYECNGAHNFTNNYLIHDEFSTKVIFRKRNKK